MADNNIKIKLTADGKQARNEIKLIDQDLQKLSHNNVSGKKEDKGGVDSASTAHGHSPEDKKANDQQRKSNDINTRILREMTLLRKELIRLNAHNSSQPSGNQSKPQQAPNTSSSGGGSNNGGNQPPLSSGQTAPNSNNSNNSNNSTDASQQNTFLHAIGGKLGKLALAMGSLSVLKGIYNKASGYANSAENAESMAYRTYGTTLWYNGKNGYNEARVDTSKLGEDYGYNLQESMSVVDTIKSNAGLTTKENLKEDADAIMRTSKAFDIDTGRLANAVSTTDKLGITKQGDYRKLTDVFAEGIVQSGMIDRADEQIQANQSIIDTLSSKTSRLSEDGMLNALQSQVALAQTNSALKGQKGASMIEAVASTATNNQDLKLLLGYGTNKYSGLEGELALEEKIAKDPVGLTREALNTYLNQTGSKVLDQIKGMSDEELDVFVRGDQNRNIKGNQDLSAFRAMLKNATGKDASTVTDYVISELKNLRDGKSGADLKRDTSKGQEIIDKNLGNYDKSKVSIQEKKKVNEERAEQDTGDLLNRALAPFRDMYNNLSDGQRTALKVGGTVVGGAGGLYGLYRSVTGANGLFNTVRGLFGGSAKTVAETAGKGASTAGKTAETVGETIKNATGSVDDIAKGASKGAETVAETVGKGAEVASKSSKLVEGASKLAPIAKKAGIVGVAIDGVATGIDIHEAIKNDDNREASQETGGFAGRLAGMWLGAKLGASSGAMAGGALGSVVPGLGNVAGAGAGGILGGIAGGIGGLFVGDKIGSYLGTSAYDAFGDKQRRTPEQEKEILKYYNEVEKIYKEKGSGEASKYTNEVVAPYLQSIGVSQSYTDDYKTDWGKNDFIKDVERGAFGDTLKDATTDKFNAKDTERLDALASAKTPEERRERLLEISQREQAELDDASESIVKASADIAGVSGIPKLNTNLSKDRLPLVTPQNSFEEPLSTVPLKVDNPTDSNTEAVLSNTTAIDNPSNTVKTLNLDDQKSLNLDGKPAVKPAVTTPVSLDRTNTSKGASAEEVYNEQILTALKENTEALERNTEKSFGENQTSSIVEQIVPSSAIAEKQEKSDSLWDKFKSIFGLDDEPKSHAVGNDYVPYDNYLASLHRGEMVLTKMEADKYRQGSTNTTSNVGASSSMNLNINVTGSVEGMTHNNQERIVQAIVAKISSMSGLQGMLSNGFTRIQNM